MSDTARIKCKGSNCQNEYQDKKHGKGIRVCNKLANNKGYRCTICGTVNAG